MFGALTAKFTQLFSGLAQKKKLTEDNISDAVREVRLALLEADVNYSVTKQFVRRVKEKALGDAVIGSVEPGQQFIKIVHDELVSLMGGEEASFDPSIVMLCGLQGSGKTTQAAKLAYLLKKKEWNRKPLLVACDLQRPAAIEQLKILAGQVGVPLFARPGVQDPLIVMREALIEAKEGKFDALIIDTAGRLHIDEALMQELEALKKLAKPTEILFVANAATGQDATTVAKQFNERVEVTGTILTMLDGDTRAGAAISIREVTGKPLKFEGIGEKIEDLQLFNPSSMADRILGMGDTINLVKKAQEHVDEEEAKRLEDKIRKASFTYEDYLKQMQMMKKMGPMKSLLKMLPGMGEMELPDGEFKSIEAIILSMTPLERQERVELSATRRKRIAKGSGTGLDDVNRLVKGFKQTKQFFKNMPNMKQLEKLMGGMATWR